MNVEILCMHRTITDFSDEFCNRMYQLIVVLRKEQSRSPSGHARKPSNAKVCSFDSLMYRLFVSAQDAPHSHVFERQDYDYGIIFNLAAEMM